MDLDRQFEAINESPVVAAVLNSVSGLLAVLNEERQTVAVNDSFIAMLGIDNPASILGLRPGEVVNCIHAGEEGPGCGTGAFCATCGAAIAIAATLSTNRPEERKCILTTRTKEGVEDFCFEVKASPLELGGRRFVILFLQNISEQERRSALARTFIHDFRNMVMGLGCTIELMSKGGRADFPRQHARIRRIAESLARELRVQTAMTGCSYGDVPAAPGEGTVQQVVQELKDLASTHPAAAAKRLTVEEPLPDVSLFADLYLLFRVLSNMVINAFEATDDDGEIRLRVNMDGEAVVFSVWNQVEIPRSTALRIFQRYFSTKREPGRGMGTFSMKLIGEKLLNGKVSFTTSEKDGTVFSFSLPKVASRQV